jgi:multidrug transporter EmrE-like cation transporter
MVELWAVALVVVACFVGSFGPILIKKGTATLHRQGGIVKSLFAAATNVKLVAGICVYGISQVLFVPALRGGDLSILYPLVAVGYVFVSIWAVVLLKERMTVLKWAGIFMVLVGVTLVGLA